MLRQFDLPSASTDYYTCLLAVVFEFCLFRQTLALKNGEKLHIQVTRTISAFVGFCLAGYLLLCGLFFAKQRSLLYFPVPAHEDLETLDVPNTDATVRASIANADNERAIVYFGGNAEDVSITAKEISRRFPDQALYAMHYRGYGTSEGTPSETALVSDANALLDLVSQKHRTVRVIGRSLGTGVAIQSAVGRRIENLTLVTPYGSIERIAEDMFWFLPVRLLIKDTYESTAYAGLLQAPVFVLVAERDEVIPQWSTQSLIDSLPAATKAKVIVAEGFSHNDLQLDPNYWRLLGGFISSE